LVTCFIDTSRFRSDDRGSANVYWDTSIAHVKYPLVVYGDRKYCDFIKSNRPEEYPTEYNERRLEDLVFYNLYDKIENNRKKSWPTSDSRAPTAVHIIHGNKILMLNDVANRNPFNTKYFAFMDCNLLNKMNISIPILEDRLSRLTNTFHVMVLGVTDVNANYEELYQRYRFMFVGGFIAGDKEHCNKVSKLFYDEYIRTVDAGYGHGEEMIYTKILYSNARDLFTISYGDYQECVRNIHEIVQNHEYIVNYCLIPYNNHCMHSETVKCADKLLDSHNLPEHLIITVLYYKYMSHYWLNQGDEVCSTLNRLFQLVEKSEIVKSQFNSNKEFYMNNIKYASKFGYVI